MGLKFLEKDERVPYISETMKLYEKAGIGEVKDLYKRGKRPALLLVDLQKTFTSPDSPVGAKDVSREVAQIIEGVVRNTATLLDAVRRKGLPVVYITSVFEADGSEGGPTVERNPNLLEYCKRGTKWVEVSEGLEPRKGDFRVEKKTSSGFIGTPLASILAFNRADTCIVTGLSISACVRQTTVDAVACGYYAVIPEECVGDRSIGAGKASLFDIMMKFADVAVLDDVLKWVRGLE